MRTHLRRAAFDPAMNFFTNRAFPINGQTLGPDQPFDRSLVTLRRLRQMYDNRTLRGEFPESMKLNHGRMKVEEIPTAAPPMDFGDTRCPIPMQNPKVLEEAKQESLPREMSVAEIDASVEDPKRTPGPDLPVKKQSRVKL